jgi:hypothetical protein
MRRGAMQALRAGCIRAGWVLRCAAGRWRRGGLVEYARAGFGDARTVHYTADAVPCAAQWSGFCAVIYNNMLLTIVELLASACKHKLFKTLQSRSL